MNNRPMSNLQHLHPSPSIRGYLFVLSAVLFWSGSASLAKYLFTTAYDTLIIVQTRSSLSFVIFAIYFAVRNRSVFKIDRNDLLKFVFVGVIGVAGTNFTYYYAVQESTVATAILIQYIAPVLVMTYAVFVIRSEHLSTAKMLSMGLALLGCFFAVTGGSFSSLELTGWGLGSGFASALGYAFMLLMSKHLLAKYSVWTMLTYAFGFATVFWLFVNPPWEIAAKGYGVQDWGVFLLFAVVSILIPHSLFSSGLKLLEASTVGIVTTLEPVFSIFVAHMTLGEAFGGAQIGGAIAVVSAIILLQLRPFRHFVRNRHVE